MNAKALQVVIRIRERNNFGFTSIARAGIQLADVEGATNPTKNFGANPLLAAGSDLFRAASGVPGVDELLP